MTAEPDIFAGLASSPSDLRLIGRLLAAIAILERDPGFRLSREITSGGLWLTGPVEQEFRHCVEALNVPELAPP